MSPSLSDSLEGRTDATSRSLRVEAERFRLLIEDSHDMIIEVTPGGSFYYVSPNVKAVLGYDPQDLLLTRVFEHVHPEDLPVVMERFALPDARVTCRYRHKDGSWRWLETHGRDLVSPGGNKRCVLIARDVTERQQAGSARQRLEEHLRQIHKLESLGMLASGIAHDFNNLLAVIMGYIELAVHEVERPEAVVKYLAEARKGGARARELVRQIFAFSRKQNPERKPVQLQAIVGESIRLLRHTIPATVEIDAQLDPATSVVLAEPTQIHQVMINLCTNAAHAMQQRPGRIAISLKECDAEALVAQAIPGLRPGRYAQIKVTDTGHGMDAETLKHIFEPFFTTKEPGEGTGLGLAGVQSIVGEHHGAITVQSEPGSGTTFEIYFPIFESAASQPDESSRPLPRGNGERILIVDDEPAVCASYRELLTQLGYRVTAETNPETALGIFRDAPDEFDLLISDLTMPGMNGVEIARQFLELNRHLPVLLTSGSQDSLTFSHLREIGVHDLLSKPASLPVVAEAIHRALGRRRVIAARNHRSD